MKLMTLALAGLVSAIGCNVPVESGSSAGGTGGASGGAGGTTVSISGIGGDAGATSSGGGGEGGALPCKVPGPVGCGPKNPFLGYVDPFLAYNPEAAYVGMVTAIPDTPEVGNAAAGALLGPWEGDQTVAGMSVVVAKIGGELPDPVTVSVWTEAKCGLPTDDPHVHEFEVPLALFTIEDLGVDRARLTLMFDEPFTVISGQLVALSLSMVDLTVGIVAYTPPKEGIAYYSTWWGLVDNNCDGKVDPKLGWAHLDAPTAKGVLPWAYDEGFGLVVLPPAAIVPPAAN